MADLNPQIPLAANFTSINMARSMGEGEDLAQKQMETDTAAKAKADEAALQDAIRGGADMYSAAGLLKTAESLKGRVTPKTYAAIHDMGTSFDLKQMEMADKVATLQEGPMKRLTESTDTAHSTLGGSVDAFTQAWKKTAKLNGVDPDAPGVDPNNPIIVAAKREAEPVFAATRDAQLQALTQ